MKKLSLLVLFFLLVPSFACAQTSLYDVPITPGPTLTDPEALGTRQAIVQTAQPNFENEQYWSSVPQNCYKSMVMVNFFSPTTSVAQQGSATLIHSEQATENSSGQIIWIYRLLTANHVVRDEKTDELLSKQANIYPGNYQGPALEYAFSDYTQVTGILNQGIDIGIVTIYGYTEASNILGEKVQPLEFYDIVPGADLRLLEGPFYTLDYPGVTRKPQYTVNTVAAAGVTLNGRELAVLEPNPGSSTTTYGSSGAMVCNKYGQLVGVTISINGEWSEDFAVEKIPSTINEQIIKIITDSDKHLREIGFSF
jgi:hypothetical protein